MGRGHQAPGGEGWAPPDPGLGPEGELHGRRLPASDTNNSGRGRGRRGMWLPAADPQEAPDDCTGLSSLRADKPSFLGKAQVHMPTETPLTVPRRSPAPPRPETQALRRWLSKAGRPSGMLQRECAAPSPSARSVLSGHPHSAQGPWFPWRGAGGGLGLPAAPGSPRAGLALSKPLPGPSPWDTSAASASPQSKFLGTQHSLTWSKPSYCLASDHHFT